MMAQEAALKEIANSRLRRLLAYNKSFTCADVKIGDTVRLYKAQSKESTPGRMGPALILDIDDAGAMVKFQSQIFKVARFCVRKKAGRKGAEEPELDSPKDRFRHLGAALGSQSKHVEAKKAIDIDG